MRVDVGDAPTRPPAARRRFRGSSAAYLVGFFVLFAVLCAPWLRHSRWAVPEPGWSFRADNELVVWILWWVSTALRQDPGSLFDAPINHPVPNQLTGSEHFLSSQVLFSPLLWILDDPVQATSLTLWLACFPLSAWAMSRLLVGLGASPGPAIVGALLYVLGPLQVPIDIHGLQVTLLFFPLTALALHRLRDRPRLGRALAFGAIFLLGLLSSYYMAAMLLLVTGTWLLAELLDGREGTGRFLALASVPLAATLGAFLWFSLPYFGRQEVWAGPPGSEQGVDLVLRAIAGHILRNPLEAFGGAVPAMLAALGLLGVRRPEWRRPALASATIATAGFLLVSGGLVAWAHLPLPSSMSAVLLLPSRFFRVSFRLVALVNFGTCVLAAIALELLSRWKRGFGLLTMAGVVTFLLATDGRALFDTRMGSIAESSLDRWSYSEVGHIARETAPGPLLELPLFSQGHNLQSGHMIGSIWHRQPLITGHTGYRPAQNFATVELAGALPDEDALRSLVAQTDLRWILLRPRAGVDPAELRALATPLAASPLVGRIFTVNDWWLLEVREK